jgi:RNA polymerase sigma factor (sigma-70 family)
MVTMTVRARVETGPSDGELARAAQAGDIASLGELLERYRAPLHAAALHMLGHGSAEDAVQETFVIALRRIGDLRDRDAVGGWLHAVLRNVCLTSVRRDRALELREKPELAAGVSDVERSVEEVVDGLALRDWVWTALSALPSPLQATAMLRWFGSHPSYADIAAILELPVGTVRSRLNEAKRQLAEALLANAGLSHDLARRTRARSVSLYGAFDDRVRWENYMQTFSNDVVAVCAGHWVMRGRRSVITAVTAEAENGVELHLARVLASERVTVLEGRFETSAGGGRRSVRSTSQVHFHRTDGLTSRVHMHSTPRLGEED